MQQNIFRNSHRLVVKHICRSHQLTHDQNLQKSLPTQPHGLKYKNGQLVTGGIFYCRDSAEINGCGSQQTSSRFDSGVLRNRQQKHTAKPLCAMLKNKFRYIKLPANHRNFF